MRQKTGILLIAAGTILLAFPLLYLLAPVFAASLGSIGISANLGASEDFGVSADHAGVAWLLIMSIAGTASLTSGTWQLTSKLR